MSAIADITANESHSTKFTNASTSSIVDRSTPSASASS